jgi:hypothetical protein
VRTINIVHPKRIPAPAPWWPGSSYVTWVGVDGYYFKPSWTFASLFGPTIKAVRALTHDPILIAETGVAPDADKPAKVTDLFAGIRAHGLLGLCGSTPAVSMTGASTALRPSQRSAEGPRRSGGLWPE